MRGKQIIIGSPTIIFKLHDLEELNLVICIIEDCMKMKNRTRIY